MRGISDDGLVQDRRSGRVQDIRVGVGRVREVLGGVGRGRTGWCWRCCCGWWIGIANRMSCCAFAVRHFNADFSA